MQPALRMLTDTLSRESQSDTHLENVMEVTSILPLKDKFTGRVKQLTYAKGTKTMDVQSIIFVCNNVEENTMAHGTTWCTNLVNQFHKVFPHMNLKFGAQKQFAQAWMRDFSRNM